jgi:hypothetical protein
MLHPHLIWVNLRWVETNPLVIWYGIIYVHQLRIFIFLQGIWLIGTLMIQDLGYAKKILPASKIPIGELFPDV